VLAQRAQAISSTTAAGRGADFVQGCWQQGSYRSDVCSHRSQPALQERPCPGADGQGQWVRGGGAAPPREATWASAAISARPKATSSATISVSWS